MSLLSLDSKSSNTGRALLHTSAGGYAQMLANRQAISNTTTYAIMVLESLRKPQLIISVTGGAKYVLPEDLRAALRSGLRRATEAMDTVVLTGGTNCGIMKVEW